MICKDSQAFNTVEREGFKHLINYLAPHYSMPSRKTFGKKIDENYMLMRFIEIRGFVAQILCKYSGAPAMISPTELEELREICKVLKPFEEITREFSGEKYVTLSKVIPLINGLAQQLQEMEAENDVAKQLKTQMLCDIKFQFPSLEKKKLYAITTLFVYSRIYFNERDLWGLSVSYPDSTMTK